MENKLDQLFRNKLLKYQENPSSAAWEKIHNKLAPSRRVLWMKRFAIAASFLLFATVGFWVYRSSTDIEVSNDHNISQSVTGENNEINEQNVIFEALIPDKGPAPESTNSKQAVAENKKAEEALSPARKHDEFVKVTNSEESASENSKVEKTTETQVQNHFPKEENNTAQGKGFRESMEEIEDVLPQQPMEEPLLAENSMINVNKISSPVAKTKKSYAEVKIIYKADSDSKLVSSGRKSILNKGLNKITEFSEEHLLTADRKEKLRNTTEDLLALNFGKLLNKSNKESENY